MKVYPAIDIRDGRCVRLRQGDYAQETRYADDPAEVAARFRDAGASCLHVVDLDGAKAGRPVNADPVARIAAVTRAAGMMLQVGGGIRTRDDAARVLALGVDRVIVGSKAIADWDGFAAMTAEPDLRGRVVLGLDAREGRVAVHGWMDTSNVPALELALRADDLGLPAIVYTDIARDGMLAGPNVEATRALAAAIRTPVIHSGGVTTADDMAVLRGLPIDGAIIGRALYEGTLDLPTALRIAAGG